MTNNVVTVTSSEIFLSIAVGMGLNFIYFYLLWQTVKFIAKVKNLKLWLFLSMMLRICLFFAIVLIFSGKNIIIFMTVFLSFIITRYILLIIYAPKFHSYLNISDLMHDKKAKSDKKEDNKKESGKNDWEFRHA